MNRLVIILSCAVILLGACGKKEEKKNADNAPVIPVSDTVSTESAISEVEKTDAFYAKVKGDPQIFLQEFAKFDDVQKYYFCAAFTMGAMSIAKPVTASAMVNYFMGLGVAKYGTGINDSTYPAFNSGKNVFYYENIINTILNDKICENVMEEAADFAKEKNLKVGDLDKMGNKEVHKVIHYIQSEK